VLAVAVLRALAGEGAHAAAVAAQLDASDVWAAYRGQRHDLFLPAGAGAKARATTRAPCAAPRCGRPGLAADGPVWPARRGGCQHR